MLRAVKCGSLAGLSVLLGWVCTGCGMTMEVTAKPDLAGKSVEVHLVGINPSELEEWKNYSVTKYFSPSDKKRPAAVGGGDAYAAVMEFVGGKATTQTLTPSDAVWKNWNKRNAKYVVVLADIPGFTDKDDKPGDMDPRRKILPLDAGQWDWAYWGNKAIQVQVSSGGVTCPTPHKPVAQR